MIGKPRRVADTTLPHSTIMSESQQDEPFPDWAKLRTVVNQLSREEPDILNTFVGWLTYAEPERHVQDFINPPRIDGESKDTYAIRCRTQRHTYERLHGDAFTKKNEFAQGATPILENAIRERRAQAAPAVTDTSVPAGADVSISSFYPSSISLPRHTQVFPKKDELVSPILPPGVYFRHYLHLQSD